MSMPITSTHVWTTALTAKAWDAWADEFKNSDIVVHGGHLTLDRAHGKYAVLHTMDPVAGTLCRWYMVNFFQDEDDAKADLATALDWVKTYEEMDPIEIEIEHDDVIVAACLVAL